MSPWWNKFLLLLQNISYETTDLSFVKDKFIKFFFFWFHSFTFFIGVSIVISRWMMKEEHKCIRKCGRYLTLTLYLSYWLQKNLSKIIYPCSWVNILLESLFMTNVAFLFLLYSQKQHRSQKIMLSSQWLQ